LLGGLIGGLIGWGIGGLIGGQRSFTLPDGLLVGPSFGLILGQWSGLILGLAFGLQFVLQAISSRTITSVETLSWNWNEFLSALRSGPALAPGLILGYAAHVIFGNLGISLATGSGVALAIYFGAGFAARVKVDKAFPNQGIKLSLRNASVVSLVTSLSSGLIGGLIAGLFAGPSTGLKVGLILGTIVGAFVGYFQGGSAVIQHYTLRLILWLNGDTPLNFIKFLDQCAKLIFLKKVGGGYSLRDG
jgi:hypothetical protein